MSKATQIRRRLHAAGVRFRTTKAGHLKVYCPGGIVVMPSTPSDPRSLKNAEAELRRHGVDVKLR